MLVGNTSLNICNLDNPVDVEPTPGAVPQPPIVTTVATTTEASTTEVTTTEVTTTIVTSEAEANATEQPVVAKRAAEDNTVSSTGCV